MSGERALVSPEGMKPVYMDELGRFLAHHVMQGLDVLAAILFHRCDVLLGCLRVRLPFHIRSLS